MRKHDNNIISMKVKFTKDVVVFMFCLKTDELHVLSTCFKNIFDSGRYSGSFNLFYRSQVSINQCANYVMKKT